METVGEELAGITETRLHTNHRAPKRRNCGMETEISSYWAHCLRQPMVTPHCVEIPAVATCVSLKICPVHCAEDACALSVRGIEELIDKKFALTEK
jgi:hypothetical protein